VGVPVDGHRAARALLPPGARDNVVAERVMAPEDGRRFFLGDAGAFGPQEGMTVKNLGAIVRTMPWRIPAAVAVACLLAVGGWVFAQDKPTAPAAPVQTAAAAPPPSKPTGTSQDTISFDFYYLFF
jgi:hypothetical protein